MKRTRKFMDLVNFGNSMVDGSKKNFAVRICGVQNWIRKYKIGSENLWSLDAEKAGSWT